MTEYEDEHFSEPEPLSDAMDRLQAEINQATQDTPESERPKALHVGPKKRLRRMIKERQDKLRDRHSRP